MGKESLSPDLVWFSLYIYLIFIFHVQTWVEIFKNIPNINWATFIVSAVSLGMLIGLAYVNDKFKDKLPVPIPMDMIVVSCT